MIRITADIDSKSKIMLLYRVFKAMSIIKKVKSIEIKPSNSKGYHIVIWTTHNYPLYKTYNIRKRIGDDPHRIRLDHKRKMGRQTLFYKKIKSNKPKKCQKILKN